MSLATETLPTRPTVRGSDRRSPTAGNRGQGSKWLKPSTRRRIYERDEYKCVWCSAPIVSIANPAHLPAGTRQATVDHVVPRMRGGSNRPSNLITCCAGCNAKRGHRSVPAFATVLCAKGDDRTEHVERIVCRVRAHARRKLPARSGDRGTLARFLEPMPDMDVVDNG
jgi:hypothetical protein